MCISTRRSKPRRGGCARRWRSALPWNWGWREQAYGPHPVGAYQIAFAPALFGQIVPWLMLNREGLSVLLHPLTGDDVETIATSPCGWARRWN